MVQYECIDLSCEENKWKNVLKGLSVRILINNAGFIDPKPLENANPKVLESIISVNCTTLAQMTSFLYPQLSNVAEEFPNNRSLIINMASALGGAPMKITPLYSPTKAFVRFFTESLQLEASKNIDILNVCPGSVSTEFTLHRKWFDT
jgi:uncharacterized protein